MLVYLKNRGQIHEDELESMFGYYLRSMKRISNAEDLLAYLRRAKFRNLHEFLVNLVNFECVLLPMTNKSRSAPCSTSPELLFVYGTLMRGQRLHGYLKAQTVLSISARDRLEVYSIAL